MDYVWKDGNYGVPAPVVGSIIANIEQADGVCAPGRLLDAARPLTSPIHNLFEWADEEAAENYRLLQASRIIRSVRVIFEPGTEAKIAFVHVRLLDAHGSGYVGSVRAMSDQSLREQVLAEALRQIAGLQERYRSLSELDVVWTAASIVGKRSRRKATTTAH